MAGEPKHRDAIIAAAAHLFRQHGFSATGMNDIVAESGAPKGSVYHYFRDGKAQIGEAALAFAGQYMQSRIQAFGETEPHPAAFLRGLCANSAEALRQSGFRNGCTVAGVVLDTPPSETRIMKAADDTLALWRGVIREVCVRAGVPETRAAFVASVAISAFEGALIQGRAARDTAPLMEAGEALAMIVTEELRKAGVKPPP